jgi:hypothetical protein
LKRLSQAAQAPVKRIADDDRLGRFPTGWNVLLATPVLTTRKENQDQNDCADADD